MPLLLRLFLLVAVALLPVIAIQSYNEIDLRRARHVEVQRHALGLARLAAAEQQQFVQGIRQVMIALSELPAIRAKDTVACEATFRRSRRDIRSLSPLSSSTRTAAPSATREAVLRSHRPPGAATLPMP
jgi:hypothetical protein